MLHYNRNHLLLQFAILRFYLISFVTCFFFLETFLWSTHGLFPTYLPVADSRTRNRSNRPLKIVLFVDKLEGPILPNEVPINFFRNLPMGKKPQTTLFNIIKSLKRHLWKAEQKLFYLLSTRLYKILRYISAR